MMSKKIKRQFERVGVFGRDKSMLLSQATHDDATQDITSKY